MVLEILRVEGMRGEREWRQLLATIETIPGVRSAVARPLDRTIRVTRDHRANIESILTVVRAAGYRIFSLA